MATKAEIWQATKTPSVGSVEKKKKKTLGEIRFSRGAVLL